MTDNADIAEYYDRHQFYYSHFWSPTALHYGLWYQDTKNLAEAIENTNRLVANTLSIGATDVVLDAGCGVGGSAIFVAKSTGAHVEGITLSNVQLRAAQAAARRLAATTLVNFSLQDYTQTIFEDATFSRVFGIESVCYARRKLDFLREAYRVMREGAKIVIVDTFLTREILSTSEDKIYTRFIEGWVVPNLPSRDQFARDMAESGFENVVFVNLQSHIWKSVKRVFRSGLITAPMNLIKSHIGVARRNLSALYQKPLFEKGIAIYGMFSAEKPTQTR